MRCSKCGYISFDYNQVCPKCNKEISSDQAKLNLPAFRPDPPYLLGALTGEANESNVDIRFDSGSAMGTQDDLETDLEDSVIMSSGDLSLDEEEDIDMSLDTEDSGEFEAPGEEITESVSDFDTGDDEEELAISFDEAQDEVEVADTGEIEIGTLDVPDEPLDKDDEIEIDLDTIPAEEPEDVKVSDADDEGLTVDLEDLDLDLDLEKSDD